jgi:hypothetical protein
MAATAQRQVSVDFASGLGSARTIWAANLEHDGGLLALHRGAVDFSVSDGLGPDQMGEDQCCRHCRLPFLRPTLTTARRTMRRPPRCFSS